MPVLSLKKSIREIVRRFAQIPSTGTPILTRQMGSPSIGSLLLVTLVVVVGLQGILTACPRQVAADEPHGATFIDDQPVTISGNADGSVELNDVAVVNASGGSIHLTLALVGAELAKVVAELQLGREGDVPAPTRAPPNIGIASAEIAPGEIWRPKVTIHLGHPPAGSYGGKLVAVGTDGSVARRNIVISIPAEAIPVAFPLEGKVLREPLPDAISLDGVRWCGPLSGTATANVQVDEALASRLTPMALVNDSGDRAVVTVEANGNVSLAGAQAGAYKGVLARGAEGEEKKPAKVAALTLNVRDGPVLPLILLVVGLAIAFALEWLSTDVQIGRAHV